MPAGWRKIALRVFSSFRTLVPNGIGGTREITQFIEDSHDYGLGSVLLLSIPPTAHAGFVYFNLPGLHPGQSARVAEQIVCANQACTGLDYQFYVLNTGLVGIDGVAFGLGATPANNGAAIAWGVLTFASANGGGDG